MRSVHDASERSARTGGRWNICRCVTTETVLPLGIVAVAVRNVHRNLGGEGSGQRTGVTSSEALCLPLGRSLPGLPRAGFLDRLTAPMPFPVRAIQVDGGSEFQVVFEEACQARGIRLFVLRASVGLEVYETE